MAPKEDAMTIRRWIARKMHGLAYKIHPVQPFGISIVVDGKATARNLHKDT
jgi:hypothetical protein